MYVEFEEGPSPDDLEAGQHNPGNVYVRDEHVARHLADVLQEAEVLIVILQPREFEVAVDVRAVRVPIPQVPVVVFSVRRN